MGKGKEEGGGRRRRSIVKSPLLLYFLPRTEKEGGLGRYSVASCLEKFSHA